MALVIRIDVDRPYGRKPFHRHVLSRIASDWWLPRIPCTGYLQELEWMIEIITRSSASAFVFFRRCTLPTPRILQKLNEGMFEIGLHLENSRNFETFLAEKVALENYVRLPVRVMSKHGSGGRRFGRTHYAPYEPSLYSDWSRRAGVRVFLGNLEDPTIEAQADGDGLLFFPSAYWLEPDWRDTQSFPVEWLECEARRRDIVLLVHPENVLQDQVLTKTFVKLVSTLPTTLLN